MLNSIKYNFAHLTDLSGRDARQTFWFWILFLVVVQYAMGLLSTIPMMASVMSDAFSAAASGADPEELSREMMQQMFGYIEFQMYFSVVVGFVMIALVTASFVRRLHDAGFSGWIAVIPIATQVFALIYSLATFEQLTNAMMTSMDPSDPTSAYAIQAEIAPWSLVGWIGYLVVIGFGILKSQDGPNQYGGEPVRH